MKKVKNILLSIFVLLLIVCIYPNKVGASTTSIMIGNEIINVNESKDIYGGTAALEKISAGNYVLTLTNVNITDKYEYGTSGYGILFGFGNLTIKLVGENTISSTYDAGSSVVNYSAIALPNGTNYNLNVIGKGSLTITASDYQMTIGLLGKHVSFGEIGQQGPTINLNLKAGTIISMVTGINNIYEVINTNIKCNTEGNIVQNLYTAVEDNVSISDSDINIYSSTDSDAVGIYSSQSNVLITDSEIKIVIDGSSEASDIAIGAQSLIKIKDSVVVNNLSGEDDSYFSLYNTNDKGHIEFERTTGKDLVFIGNGIIDTRKDIVFTNISDSMIYSSSLSFDTVEPVVNFDQPNFIDNNYKVISSGLDNKIESGNNQSLKKASITSYSFDTNHYRYLVYGVTLNDNPLDEEDYTLSKDGKVTITATGLTKLNTLDYGNQKIDIHYYFGNKLTANFKIVDKIETATEANPQTSDNIVTSIILVSISMISLASCGLYINKKNLNN